ncbi:beta-lactamase family protein [Opitutaceae bacterium]|nr:beta-lactamase family protein [Opitutaceae bacterium]
MRSLSILLAILTLSVAGAIAQTPSANHSPTLIPTAPGEVGLSPDRLDRIDTMIEDAIAAEQIPGAVALIARNGKIAYHRAFGSADPTGTPLEIDSIFRIASQTKAITSTAVMMLWEEGHFQLDDPVSKFLPEFANPTVLVAYGEDTKRYSTRPAKREITIRHLITHNSGIGYGIIDRDPRMKQIYIDAGITDLYTTEPVVLADNVKKIAALPLVQDPGEGFHYSEGLDVAGRLVEVISGQPYDEFLRTRIFEPLGMKDTQFYLSDAQADRLVTVQTPGTDGWKKYIGTDHYDADYPIKGARTWFGGGAGLTSTVRDYAAFLQMYLNGGEYLGTRLLSRTTIETIMAFQTELTATKYYSLAFGVVTPAGVAHGGLGGLNTFSGGGYFNSSYFADPEEKVLAMIFKQTRGQVGDQTAWKFAQMTFAAIDD